MRPWTAAVALAFAATAFAHDTWLLPTPARVQVGATVVFQLTSAMDFPRPETPVKADRLVAGRVRLAGSTHDLRAEAQPEFLRLSAVLDRQGVAAAWIETRPRTLDLKPEEVAHYLEEVGAADTVGAEWKKSGGKVWRETYVKLAKTYVRVGEPSEDRSWAEPLGLALEMVPEKDPTRLKEGESLPLRILWQGKPISGLSVGSVGSGPGRGSLRKTDAEGRVSVVLDRPGPWLLRATLIRAAGSGEGQWNSHFTTLTLEVGASASTSLSPLDARDSGTATLHSPHRVSVVRQTEPDREASSPQVLRGHPTGAHALRGGRSERAARTALSRSGRAKSPVTAGAERLLLSQGP